MYIINDNNKKNLKIAHILNKEMQKMKSEKGKETRMHL